MSHRQTELFEPEMSGISPAFQVAPRTWIVQNCWNPGDWHIERPGDRSATRRCFFTLLEAVFYATAPRLWRHLGRRP